MRSTDGEELDHLLDEQLAYYLALDAGYLNQALNLPGGDEVTEALAAFQPTGSVLELACGPHQPADLARRLRQLGWDIEVTATAGPFYLGAGSRGKRQT